MSFYEATQILQISSHEYEATLRDPWTIGSVPHGGYSTSCIQRAVHKHFQTTHSKLNQPHTLALHLTFTRRTQTGPARIHVRDVKLGRQTSTVHVSLQQDDREEIVGYVTQTNLLAETGADYPTHWEAHPRPLPVESFQKLGADEDRNWTLKRRMPFPEFRKAASCFDMFIPRQGYFSPATVDQWMRLKSGEKWTNDALGYVVDAFPQIIEHFVLQEHGGYSKELGRELTWDEQCQVLNKLGRNWYPTLLLNLDVKKALPEEGVEWLFLRLQAKSIKNGRYDLEIIVKDAEGDLVALSHHMCMVVSSDRNTSARRKTDGNGTKL